MEHKTDEALVQRPGALDITGADGGTTTGGTATGTRTSAAANGRCQTMEDLTCNSRQATGPLQTLGPNLSGGRCGVRPV